jgi:hypothetical protein
MKTSMDVLLKTKIELVYNPAVPFLGIYLKKSKLAYNRDTYTYMFIAAQFHNSQIWYQPGCPSMDQYR